MKYNFDTQKEPVVGKSRGAFDQMPGLWEGTATFIDPAGHQVSRKTFKVNCRATPEGLAITNAYTDATGKTTSADVTGKFDAAGHLRIASQSSSGEAWDSEGNVIAVWDIVTEPGLRLWELSTIHDGSYRTRTWHHLRNGKLEGVTIFEERRVG
jgi:hypothetical protein